MNSESTSTSKVDNSVYAMYPHVATYNYATMWISNWLFHESSQGRLLACTCKSYYFSQIGRKLLEKKALQFLREAEEQEKIVNSLKKIFFLNSFKKMVWKGSVEQMATSTATDPNNVIWQHWPITAQEHIKGETYVFLSSV